MTTRKTKAVTRFKKSGRVEIFIKMEDGRVTIKKEQDTVEATSTRDFNLPEPVATWQLNPTVNVEENEEKLKNHLQRRQYEDGK